MAENIPQQAEQPSKEGKENYQSYGKDDRHRTSKQLDKPQVWFCKYFLHAYAM